MPDESAALATAKGRCSVDITLVSPCGVTAASNFLEPMVPDERLTTCGDSALFFFGSTGTYDV